MELKNPTTLLMALNSLCRTVAPPIFLCRNPQWFSKRIESSRAKDFEWDSVEPQPSSQPNQHASLVATAGFHHQILPLWHRTANFRPWQIHKPGPSWILHMHNWKHYQSRFSQLNIRSQVRISKVEILLWIGVHNPWRQNFHLEGYFGYNRWICLHAWMWISSWPRMWR